MKPRMNDEPNVPRQALKNHLSGSPPPPPPTTGGFFFQQFPLLRTNASLTLVGAREQEQVKMFDLPHQTILAQSFHKYLLSSGSRFEP